jgi:hypothetical protein
MVAGDIRAMETEPNTKVTSEINLDVHEWMDEEEDMDICTMKFCSAMKSRTVFARQWMKREVMLNEMNESHRDKSAFLWFECEMAISSHSETLNLQMLMLFVEALRNRASLPGRNGTLEADLDALEPASLPVPV